MKINIAIYLIIKCPKILMISFLAPSFQCYRISHMSQSSRELIFPLVKAHVIAIEDIGRFGTFLELWKDKPSRNKGVKGRHTWVLNLGLNSSAHPFIPGLPRAIFGLINELKCKG